MIIRKFRGYSSWYTLLTNTADDLVKVIKLGPDWCKLLEKTGNPYWKHIFQQ